MTKTIIKIAVPIIVLLLSFGFYQWQMSNKPEPKKRDKQKVIPIVRTSPAELVEGYRYQVSGFGVVEPAGKLAIESEVTGKVIWMSDKMKSGGMFKKNEWMYRIDDTDYKAALDSAVSGLRSAELSLKQIEEEAAISMKEWEIWSLSGDTQKKASPLVSYEPQLEAARAAVQSAQSAVVSAQSDLAKVVYKAPFDCIVTEESIEHGKIIRTGDNGGTIVRTDRYEVYVPIAAKDAIKLKFSEDRNMASDGYIELAEGKNSWKWVIYAERLLPSADEATGMLNAVLVVLDPFDNEDGSRPMLPIGASIRGVINNKDKKDMIRIPDQSLREGNIVWVLTNEDTVDMRKVKISESRGDYVYVEEGISEGENIIVSDLQGAIDGMTVTTGVNKPKAGKKGENGGAQ
jgi:RND family efflux transporter MFP subunit